MGGVGESRATFLIIFVMFVNSMVLFVILITRMTPISLPGQIIIRKSLFRRKNLFPDSNYSSISRGLKYDVFGLRDGAPLIHRITIRQIAVASGPFPSSLGTFISSTLC